MGKKIFTFLMIGVFSIILVINLLEAFYKAHPFWFWGIAIVIGLGIFGSIMSKKEERAKQEAELLKEMEAIQAEEAAKAEKKRLADEEEERQVTELRARLAKTTESIKASSKRIDELTRDS